MNVHFFSFTGLPDLILRKNYTRDQYISLQKLLLSIKNTYLEQRAKADAENEEDNKQTRQSQKHAEQNMIITEEDLVEIQLLDDFLIQHQRSFDHKRSIWRFFIHTAKEECRKKIETLRGQTVTDKKKRIID